MQLTHAHHLPDRCRWMAIVRLIFKGVKMDSDLEPLVRLLMQRLDIIDEGKLNKGFSRIKFDFSDSDFTVTVSDFGEKAPDDDFDYLCVCGAPSVFLLHGFGLGWYCGNKQCLDKISHNHFVLYDLDKTSKFQKLLERAIKWAQK